MKFSVERGNMLLTSNGSASTEEASAFLGLSWSCETFLNFFVIVFIGDAFEDWTIYMMNVMLKQIKIASSPSQFEEHDLSCYLVSVLACICHDG